MALDKMGKFNFDDIPTLGHLALQRHRELLHYARIAEWEMPKLKGKWMCRTAEVACLRRLGV